MDAGYDYACEGNYYETVREAVVAIHEMVWRELRDLVAECAFVPCKVADEALPNNGSLVIGQFLKDKYNNLVVRDDDNRIVAQDVDKREVDEF